MNLEQFASGVSKTRWKWFVMQTNRYMRILNCPTRSANCSRQRPWSASSRNSRFSGGQPVLPSLLSEGDSPTIRHVTW